MSPTIASPVMTTGVGMILGAAACMAPEQAKGRAADKRSDIWAIGWCVLPEMLVDCAARAAASTLGRRLQRLGAGPCHLIVPGVQRLGVAHGLSGADHLREVIEVLVSCVQGKVVLQYKSRQPHIVRRNRCALFPELAEHGSVVVSRLVVGKENTHSVFQQEASQDPLVLGLPTTVREAGPKLTDYDERQHDRFGFLQERHCLGGPSAEIDVPVRVESNPHRQRFSSTLS